MDPLSITASIIAILKLSGEVLTYLNDVEDASQDRARCAIEASNLHSLLFNLRFHLEKGILDQSWYTAVRALAVKNGPLDQFKEALEMLQTRMTDRGRLGKFGRALTWSFKKEEMTCIFTRIERLKSLIEIALHMDHFTLSQAIKDDTCYLRTHITGIESGLDAIQLQEDSAKHRMLLEWISRSDYPAQQSTLITERREGTGQWFLTAPEMIRWKNEVKATLFCPGIPGGGKTVAAAIAIDHLLGSVQSDSQGVAYMYCNYKAQQQQDLVSLLAAILKQLVQGRLSAIEHVEQLYQRHVQHGTKPSLRDICDTLEHVLNYYLTVYIVIDALDECQDSTRRQLVAKLRNFQARRDVRLLVTSRFMPEIESDFKAALRLEVRSTKEDVERFVAGRTCELPMVIRRDTVMQELVQEKIADAADGMFLLAGFHTDSLLGTRTVKEVKLALANLLKGTVGLRKAYENAFHRIESQTTGDCELAKKVLSWITLAKRPLTTSELSCALAVEPNESAIDPDNIYDTDDLVSVCAGLVVVDQGSSIIRLVHYTAQEYLERTIDDWNPGGRLHLATTCLTYLAFDVFKSGGNNTQSWAHEVIQNRFLSYAGNYWGYHARAVEDKVIQLSCAERLRNALSCALRILENPINMSDRYHNCHSTNGILHYLGICGLFCMIRSVSSNLDRHGLTGVDEEDGCGRTPLSYAAEHGHLEIVRLLLDKGADVNKCGGFYGNALQAASAGGNKQVAELLLDKGARLNTYAGHYNSALCAASANGHYDVVKLLSARGANINEHTSHSNALERASANGHKEVIKFLLDRGAEIKGRDSTALHEAAGGGYEQVVKMLLDKGAEINAKDTDGSIALHKAAGGGHEQVVKLLLDEGAEINALNTRGSTALHEAAHGGHEQVTRLLLDRKAEVNIHGQEIGNALWEASLQNKEQVVRLLLDAGADVNSQNKHHGGVVRAASFLGNAQMLELLLSSGAKADLPFGFSPSPLYLASERNQERVVETLLQAGVDPNVQGGEHGTALFAASMQGHEKVVKLLLEKNADSNTQGAIYNNTPLYAASSKGHGRVVELLLDDGADVNAQGGYYGTALFAASIQGYRDVVKLLLKKGADPNTQGAKYKNTPLYAASSQGHLEIVRLLVEGGADVNVQEGYWGNALVAASKAGHVRVVELLRYSIAHSCQQPPSSNI